MQSNTLDSPSPAPRAALRATRSAFSLAGPLLLGAAVAIAASSSGGSGLGLFFAGTALVALLVPAMVLSEEPPRRQLAAAALLILPSALIWLSAQLAGPVSPAARLACIAVLVAFAASLATLTRALARLRLPPPLAAAIVSFLALAWLSWPFWLSPWLTGSHRETLTASLIAPHPLFALDGALHTALPVPWTQHPLAYRLSSLGTDVPYSLPTTTAWCILAHALIALACSLAPAWRYFGETRRSTFSPAPGTPGEGREGAPPPALPSPGAPGGRSSSATMK